MTKKLIVILAMLVGLVSGAWADLWKYNGWRSYYLAGFEKSQENIKNNLIQIRTNRRYSCGVTSALFAYNYIYYRQNSETLQSLSTLRNARNKITELYNNSDELNGDGSGVNDILHTFQPLIDIGLYDFGLSNVKQMDKKKTLKQNLIYMINDLRRNNPVIISLKPGPNKNRRNSHSLNPVGNFGHVVIVTSYLKTDSHKFLDDDVITYYDPFYGGNHWMTLKEFKNQVNLEHLDYLRFAD